jgi:putrescine transport system permease protein
LGRTKHDGAGIMKKGMSLGKKTVIGIPLVWLLLFLFLPFLYLFKISLADAVIAAPPFTALTHFENGVLNLTLDFKHYALAITHSGFLWAFLSSIRLAFITTCLCIVIGYPMAYAIARMKSKWRLVLLISIILPYWTSFLIRAYAWINLLQNNGIVNQTLIKLGVIQFPLHLLYSNFAVYIGLLYGYLPYFVLPLYATLVKLDYGLQEAALDLGARPLRAFWSVIWPLSIPGVLVGALLVFIPAVGEVVIPQILGGLQTLMIGNIIWQEFFIANNWCLAAALALIMLVILIFPIVWLLRIQSRMEIR